VNTIYNRLRGSARGGARGDSESGLSIIEVMVAMMIFAIMSVGVAYSIFNVLTITSDARSRQTAANIAATAIDADRAATDVVDLAPVPTTTTVDGVVYTTTTATAWIGATAGTTTQCTTGSGALIAKRVNVTVKWQGMRKGQSPVRVSTIVSPTSRLTDITLGVIVVAVNTAAGGGYAGVTISAAPATTNPNGAIAITGTIAPTDVNGCGVILGVTPGNYVVSISKTASVDINQNPLPTTAVSVVAGSSVTAGFQYDLAGTFNVSYHSNYTTGTITMPTSMTTSFVNTYGIYTSTSSGPFSLHPFPAGYSIIAGALGASGGSITTCNSVDPGAWPASSDGTLVPQPQAPAAAGPGGTVVPSPVPVRMGVFSVSGLGGKYLKATAQTTGPAGTGDPGCSVPSTYVIKIPTGASASVALPFGTWSFLSGTVTTQSTAVASSAITALTAGTITSVSSSFVLTLDPRLAPLP
jgi:Tfp pilus assembly protein PilV